MSGKCRPSLRPKTLENVGRSNLSTTDKECIRAVFERFENSARVVRCKDCKFWCIQDGNNPNWSYFCSVDKMWCMPARKADDFCSYGERKE